VRVADDVQGARGAPAGDIGTMFDEQSSHASFPEARLDEQRIELGIPVRPRQDCGETDDHAVALRQEHVAIRDLLDRQRDRVRIREQRVTIARIGERSAPLQRLEAGTFGEQCRSDHHVGIQPFSCLTFCHWFRSDRYSRVFVNTCACSWNPYFT